VTARRSCWVGSDRNVDEGGRGNLSSDLHFTDNSSNWSWSEKKSRKKFRLALLQPGSNVDGSLHLGKVLFFSKFNYSPIGSKAQNIYQYFRISKTTYDAFDHDLVILDRCHNKPLDLEKFKYVKNSNLCVLWPKWIKTSLYLQDFLSPFPTTTGFWPGTVVRIACCPTRLGCCSRWQAGSWSSVVDQETFSSLLCSLPGGK